jgi:hypothetical protein
MDVLLRLPRLAPEQALALMDALDDLQRALWEAYEPVVVPILLEELDCTYDEPPCDGPGDDVPF